MPAEWNRVTEAVIGSGFRVYNTLGYGFMEKVYENALVHEIQKLGLDVKHQLPVKVWYDEVVVGDYVIDLLVAQKVVVELKTARALKDVHVAQTLNYLAATQLRLALILNFSPTKLEVRRLAH